MASRSSSASRKSVHHPQSGGQENWRRQIRRRKTAGMESGRSLCGHRRAGSHPRSRPGRCGLQSVRSRLQRQARGRKQRSPTVAPGLRSAVRRYEAIDDLAGRLGSYAGLIHAGDSVDPAISKFYGDVSERLTAASVHLLFFALELNRIDDDVIETRDADAGARALSSVDRGQPQGQAVSARGSRRAALPRKVADRLLRVEQAVRSDHSGLRFKVGGKELAIEPTLNLLQDRSPDKRKAAGQALAKTFKANERTFALVTNTLAKDKDISDRWRGFQDVADSRHLNNRVEREVVDALVASVRAAYPRLSHRYYALKAGGSKRRSSRIGTATRRCRSRPTASFRGATRARWC